MPRRFSKPAVFIRFREPQVLLQGDIQRPIYKLTAVKCWIFAKDSRKSCTWNNSKIPQAGGVLALLNCLVRMKQGKKGQNMPGGADNRLLSLFLTISDKIQPDSGCFGLTTGRIMNMIDKSNLKNH
jgi:hypothetical protein